MDFRAVIFDMDGVLIDSEPSYNKASAKYFKDLRLPFGKREIRALTGASGAVVADYIRQWYPDIPYTAEELAERHGKALLDVLKREVSALIPGVQECLRHLMRGGKRLAIGSSSTAEMVYYVARTFGLDPLMDAIVTCDDAPRGKPWPDIYLACSQRLGIPPADCIVVEDSTNGIRAARAAGMRCAAFTGTNRHGLDLSEADCSFCAYGDAAFARIFGPCENG